MSSREIVRSVGGVERHAQTSTVVELWALLQPFDRVTAELPDHRPERVGDIRLVHLDKDRGVVEIDGGAVTGRVQSTGALFVPDRLVAVDLSRAVEERLAAVVLLVRADHFALVVDAHRGEGTSVEFALVVPGYR